jgi:hypothetical protein
MIFMVTIMGALCWIVFSFLIIFNIANIHNDPPFWRVFLYGLVDVGLLMQMVVIWNNPDPQSRARQATGCLVMAGVGAVQALVGIVYYFMAQTEMFLSPLTQAWTYGALRGFAGDNAEKLEKLVRELLPVNKDFWSFHNLLDPAQIKIVGEPAGRASLDQLAQLCQQPTLLDGLFKLIPTFEPAPHAVYQGMIDYMVNNRWVFDYITFVDRMTPGVVKPYPIGVPPLDMVWVWVGPIVVIAGLMTWNRCKRTPQAKPAQAQPQPVVSST